MDNTEKLRSLLGLMRRAGKLVPGFDAAKQSVLTAEASGVLTANDLSEKTHKNLCFYAAQVNIPVQVTQVSIAEMSHAIGKKAGIVAVTDKGFFQAALKIIKTDQEPEKPIAKG